MDVDLPETSELQAFVRTAETGSISAAARELGVPRATVSRRIERLEERLATRLMRRTTRQLRLTDAGRELFDRARLAIDAARDAAETVRRHDDVPRGLLRISMPSVSGVLGDVVHEFIARYPQVNLELIRSSVHEDLVARNIDVALRAGTHIDPGLTMRKLSMMDLIAVASPDYLAAAPRLRTLSDLSQHRLLVGFDRGQTPATHWPCRDGSRVRVRAYLAVNDIDFVHHAALRGTGITLLPQLAATADLDAGRLRPVLPRKLGTQSFLALVYPEKQLMKASARAFIDYLVGRLDPQTLQWAR